MRKMVNSIIIIISILFIGGAIIVGLMPNIVFHSIVHLGCFVIPMIISFIAMIAEIKRSKTSEEKEQLRKFWLKVLFIIYCILLVSILFLDNEYRTSANTHNIAVFSKEHLEMTNIIPFQTITDFFTNWNIKASIFNIGVNLVLFAPMGFFMPMLFGDRIKTVKHFIMIIIIITVGAEIIQFLTFKGATDIDDVIINTLGALIAYLFMKTKVIRNLLDNTIF